MEKEESKNWLGSLTQETEAERLHREYHNEVIQADNEVLKWFNFWLECQSWESAGKISLQAVKELAEDHNYCAKTAKKVIALIEREYRSYKHDRICWLRGRTKDI